MTATKTIQISGYNQHLGFSRIYIDVLSEAVLIDTYRAESQFLTFEDLWAKYGRKACKQLQQMYGVPTSNIRKPSTVRL